MASNSPQRTRRPPAIHPATQVGSMLNLRESSRSPSLRARSIKSHSMPIVPPAMQIFAASQPSSQIQQQPSPTSSIGSRRSPPAGPLVQRLLPTPPHPPPNVQDASQNPQVSPSVPPQHLQNLPNPHYPRPVHRAPPQFLNSYQNIDQESWEVTDELMADIERAAMQQTQAQNDTSITYGSGYNNTSPPRDSTVERVRTQERSSPKHPDPNQQQQRRQQAARESPNVRDRQPTSPTTSTFQQAPSQTPERRSSPYQNQLGSATEHAPAGYMQYTHEPPAAIRRTTLVPPVDNRPPPSLATQTPPLQTIPVRTPDRSLPVQEEVEDEPRSITKHGAGADDAWQDQNIGQHMRHTGSSPAPSSDLNPDNGYNNQVDGSTSRAALRDTVAPAVKDEDASRRHHSDQGDDSYTPRSPTAELPEHPPVNYYPTQTTNARVIQNQPLRSKHSRNGSTDQLGLRTFDPSVFEGDNHILVMNSEQTQQHTERRKVHVQPQPQSQSQSQTQPQSQSQPSQPRSSQQYYQAPYYQPQMYPEDMTAYDSSYLNAYLQSPRPGAPIPPTPHSQTAAPSPSPAVSALYDGVNEPFSPVPPIGSPYPYPFNHVRRNQSYQGHPNRPSMPASFDANELSRMHMETMKQWQAYAMNNQQGNITDSTLSPTSTPFRLPNYDSWAYLHTNKTLGRMQDTVSIRSSPSHEPIPLAPPAMIGVKKTTTVRRHRSSRKPPPRVESTQPRETSPEPSSSGEETAGEERIAVSESNTWVNGSSVTVTAVEDTDEWFDEEDDNDDLLELEFHPNYVSNLEKRRRRWETGWEHVTQAIQNLDRQTDTTIVVMAAPSHSHKLYTATSRSVRRLSAIATNAITMKEMRNAFSRIATQRRAARSHKSSLIDRLLPSNSSGDGSDGSSESREEDLRRLLEGALGSLAALGGMYEQREARWHDEMRRVQEDRERVELLLKQVLGENRSPASTSGGHSSASNTPSTS